MSRFLGYFTIALAMVSATAAHASVQFDIGANNSPEVVTAGGTGNRWLTGTGYGDDASEASGTLLDVEFDIDNNLPSVMFTLANPGDMSVFRYGTIDFQEGNSNFGIRAAETDDLGVTAFLVFDMPSSVGQVSSIAAAVTGNVNDAADDYIVTFLPVIVPFAGGTFQLDLIDSGSGLSILGFDGNPGGGIRTRLVDAKVTLLTAPPDDEPRVIPEMPSGLVWLALVGCASGVFWAKRPARAPAN